MSSLPFRARIGVWARASVGVLAYLTMVLSFGLLGAAVADVGWLPRTLERGQRLPLTSALAIDLALIASFAVVHSLMVRQSWKRFSARIIPPAMERSTYVLVSSLQLAMLCLCWVPIPASALWQLEGPVRWPISIVGAAGFLTVVAATFMLDHLEFTGLRGALGLPSSRPGLRRPGLYAYVRHPIYAGVLVGMWVAPTMTASRLVLAAAFTAYILVGVRLEERDLLRTFGEDYRRYQREVPMLLPRLRRRVSTP